MLRWAAAFVTCMALSGQPPQPQNWTVTGSVVDALSGRPLAGATVIWEPSFASYGFRDRPLEELTPSAGASRTATDASGAFTVSADPTATAIHLFVSHAGYRAANGKTVAVFSIRAGSAPVTVKLEPRSSITGRVTTQGGEPLSGLAVDLVRVEIHEGQRQPRQTVSAKTGANGEYRFDDLPVGVFLLRTAGSSAGKVYGPVFYPPAHYPNAMAQDQARLLQVRPGETLEANFRVDSHASFHVRGLIANMPLRRPVSIRLLHAGAALGQEWPASPNGLFDLSGVAPGSYTVQAYTPGVTPLNLGEAEATVKDRDVTGVKITMSEGQEVAGHIDFHGPGTLERYAVVYAASLDPRHWPGEVKDTSAVMDKKGNFVLKNLQPGKYDISVRNAANFYLEELKAESSDGSRAILDQGLTVPAKGPVGLAITMKSGAAEIGGTIEGASPAELYSVALVVMRDGVAVPQVVRANAGKFQIPDLAPGDYSLLAWTDARAVEYRNAEVLQGLLKDAVNVSLTEGARRNVVVTPAQ